MSGQLNAPAALIPRKHTTVPMNRKFDGSQTKSRPYGEKSIVPAANRTLADQPVAISTELSCSTYLKWRDRCLIWRTNPVFAWRDWENHEETWVNLADFWTKVETRVLLHIKQDPAAIVGENCIPQISWKKHRVNKRTNNRKICFKNVKWIKVIEDKLRYKPLWRRWWICWFS